MDQNDEFKLPIHGGCQMESFNELSIWSALLQDPILNGSTRFIYFFFFSQANEDITQVVEMLPSGTDKWSWLTRRLVEFTSSGSVLIFVTKKANSEELAANLTQEGYSLGLLHGDMDQSERNKVISDFKKKNLPVLVATDVAGELAPSHWESSRV